ncbi:hypothetical protein [Burkholderia pyrrocinia]|uniref:hypothetical protein n=1 Tax=Burkholderia pyrrocinia TaxID=60550 RepID=UPI002AB27BE5|nr:hypothetical protein [Burkholderia pyrrocinia]
MACPIRFAGVARASAPRRLQDVRDRHGARRRAKHNRDAGRGTIAWLDFAASDAPASEHDA